MSNLVLELSKLVHTAIPPPHSLFLLPGAGRLVRTVIRGQPRSCWFPGLREPSATLHRLSFSLLPVFSFQFSRVSWVAEQGGGRAGEFGRLFLLPSGQFYPGGGRCSALAGFWPGFLLFSDPGLCVFLGREVVRPSGWLASSVATGTFLAGFRSPKSRRSFFFFLALLPGCFGFGFCNRPFCGWD